MLCRVVITTLALVVVAVAVWLFSQPLDRQYCGNLLPQNPAYCGVAR